MDNGHYNHHTSSIILQFALLIMKTTEIPAPITKRVRVLKASILGNKENKANKPVLSVKSYKGNVKCHHVVINGPSKLVYKRQAKNALDLDMCLTTTSAITCIEEDD